MDTDSERELDADKMAYLNARTKKILENCRSAKIPYHTNSEMNTTKNTPECDKSESSPPEIIPNSTLLSTESTELNEIVIGDTNMLILDIPEITEEVCYQNVILDVQNSVDENNKQSEEGYDIIEEYLSSMDCENQNEFCDVNIEVDNNLFMKPDDKNDFDSEAIEIIRHMDQSSIEVFEIEKEVDPDYIVPEDDTEFEEPEVILPRKRKKRHNVDKRTWTKNENKMRRERGESYMGKKKSRNSWNYNIPRQNRVIKKTCNCKKSLKGNALQCRVFSEDDRTEIFVDFWEKMNWDERKIYIDFLVKKQETKRKRNRKDDRTSRRNFTWTYYLKKSEEKFRVCKNMFLNTLGIKERTVMYWKKSTSNVKQNDITDNSQNSETRRTNKTDNLREFFTKLPKVESHYCRANSRKLYLEPNWNSKSALYKFYKTYCDEKSIRPVSIALFYHIFEEMNLSLYTPKKDECDKCVSYRTKNLSEEEYLIHQQMKNEAREAKIADKNSDNKVYCMDMQSVLLCPKSNVSSLYFKTKLIVHNFTVFDMKSKQGFCYLWHEAAGGVSSNDYSSIICHFLEQHVINNRDLKPKQNIIIYSDGCTSQNRNVTLANALLNMSIIHKICIEHKYLEKGHTQMEADSMHSTIERKLRKTNISVPAEYVGVCLSAREKPSPYVVEYLNYEFFRSFNSLKFLSSIRPGHKVGDPTVTDIRALKYSPDGQLFYKIRHTDEYRIFDFRTGRKNTIPCAFSMLPKLYDRPIPIKEDKWNHLQFLKSSLQHDFHSFYDNLTHK